MPHSAQNHGDLNRLPGPPHLAPHISTYLDGLNPAQREAVTHPVRFSTLQSPPGITPGPMIVLAGPGTGKTHVLSRRIGFLIDALGRKPETILALTFTVKAAAELKDRIITYVGRERGQAVRCHTFNGYGQSLIARFDHYLGLPRAQTMIDEVQRGRLLTQIILENGLFPLARGEGVKLQADKVAAAIERLTNLGATPESCLAAANAWAARLAAQQPVPTPDSLPSEQQHAQLAYFQHIVQAFTAYNHTRRLRGWMTYADQASMPLWLLRNCPPAAALIRAELSSLLVDEFQDCNLGQIMLLHELMGPQSHGGAPDLTVVGDDDQAIYGFRGSDDRAFDRFDRLWKSALPRVVELSENHRSQPQILRTANQIIANAGLRFRGDKRVIFPPTKTPHAGRVQAIRLTSDSEDPKAVPALLFALKAIAAKDNLPFRWGDIAVIVRSNLDKSRIAESLALYDIPFIQTQQRGLLTTPVAQDALAWIEWILNPAATWAARRVLIRPPIGLPANTVTNWEKTYQSLQGRIAAGLLTSRPQQNYEDWLLRLAQPQTPTQPAHQYSEPNPEQGDYQGEYQDPDQSPDQSAYQPPDIIYDHPGDVTSDAPPNPVLDPAHAAILLAALRRLAILREEIAKERGDDAVYIVLRTCILPAVLLSPGKDRALQMASALELLTFAREKQPRLDEPRMLAEFYSYLQEWGDLTSASTQRGIDAQDDGDEPNPQSHQPEPQPDPQPDHQPDHPASKTTSTHRAPNAVHILTAHGSKGLEFDTVIVPRVTPRNGYPKTGGSAPDLVLPDELIDSLDPRSLKERQLDEERRIFYVACTRAKRQLWLLAKANKNPSSSVHFFEELVPVRAPHSIEEVFDVQDIYQQAASLGMFGPSNNVISAQANDELLDGASHRSRIEASRLVADQLRAAARLQIAAALETTDAPAFDPTNLASLEAVLRESLHIIAAANMAQQARAAIPWAGQSPAAIQAAQRVALTASTNDAAQGPLFLPPPPPPLDLSFTTIDGYQRCPRCWYLRYIAKLPSRQSQQASVGSLVHRVLETYFEELREADAQGQPLPDRRRLAELARREYNADLPPNQTPDPATLDQITAQLHAAANTLHQTHDQIIELERTFSIPFIHNSVTHTIKGKIDRIDQLPGGAFRVVDYKTGHASKAKLDPESDDLQLGIYLLAMHELFGQPLSGEAQYWILATAQRGTISFASIKLEKVRLKIGKVIEGILAGEFDSKPGCKGDCQLLAPQPL